MSKVTSFEVRRAVPQESHLGGMYPNLLSDDISLTLEDVDFHIALTIHSGEKTSDFLVGIVVVGMISHDTTQRFHPMTTDSRLTARYL